MYGLREAQSGRTMVQITPSHISCAVALAASLHAVTIVLTTIDFYIELPTVDTIYLNLVAEGDGVALSASEPTLKLSSSITLPAMADQARPATDLLNRKLIRKLKEAMKPNRLVVKDIWPNNMATPPPLTPIASPKSALEKRNIELASSGRPMPISAFATAADDVTTLQAPPILSLMSSPQPTAKRPANQTPINSTQARLIEPARLDSPGPTPKSSHPSGLDTFVTSAPVLTFLTKHPLHMGKLSAPLDVIPALIFLNGPKVAPPNIISVEEQKQVVMMEAPTELNSYQNKASETIAEPLDMNKTLLGLLVTPPEIPTTMKVPPAEPHPDPLVSVLRKIAEMEENQKTRAMSLTTTTQTMDTSVGQIPVKMRSVEGADGKPLDSEIATLINSQIIENWRLPPGLMDLDLQPAFFRVLLDRTGAVILIQYLDELDGASERYRAFSESAYRAVSKTEIFLGLPPNEFEKWRELKLKFHLGS